MATAAVERYKTARAEAKVFATTGIFALQLTGEDPDVLLAYAHGLEDAARVFKIRAIAADEQQEAAAWNRMMAL